ncbi:MAG: tyrosine-protein phosphatase [Bavariicoccus seileri]|uniref:Protein-tyrosine-phosphatase n=1 Tax=Bavariicoccus seileri TaxID=549685 RepID=A0A3D4S4E0_9ENTE|nr:tyrosine-protein phosphatase [Bavariicoccus seileri]HCS93352.1 protein-tyrosine-phosphatase [Bavariicoccus seileri]
METVVNFRDLGGLKTASGQTVKSKRILRSGQLVGVSEDDRRTLEKDYQLKKIIDFRSEDEIKREPDDVLEGTTYHHIDIMAGIHTMNASLESMLVSSKEDTVDQAMKKIYEEMITNDTAQRGYNTFITELSLQERGSTLFHCFAGKDRTGVGALLFLSILGVNKQQILGDYLKTNQQRKKANEALIKAMSASFTNPAQAAILETLLSVDQVYLDHSFEIINEKYGSLSYYITNILQISLNEQKALRENYLTE